jgi:hypothetical protein
MIQSSVSYPPHEGAFFQFKVGNERLVLCRCNKRALLNYAGFIRRNVQPAERHHSIGRLAAKIGRSVPVETLLSLLVNEGHTDEQIIQTADFEDGVCHLCRKIMPDKQFYGPKRSIRLYGGLCWYERFWYYHLGIHPGCFVTAEGACSPEFRVRITGYNESKEHYDDRYKAYLSKYQWAAGGESLKVDNGQEELEQCRGLYYQLRKQKSDIKKDIMSALLAAFKSSSPTITEFPTSELPSTIRG